MSAHKNDTKAAVFRRLLTSDDLSFIMEAHNGLSAKIVEETGFDGIWASGLSLSTALGVRDRNEASWTQVLDVLEFMSDATSVPILLDGDTGYGDFNNFRRLVKKLCQRDIAAVCIEDKIFPKTNSFIDTAQPLADVDEFCGKIKAGKDVQDDLDFSIIARVEALIAGHGIKEALRRAEAYRLAGADGILIHSKKSDAQEILEFAKEWANRAPLVIVPTKYYTTPTEAYRLDKVSLIIWANHNLRASLTAMRDTSRKIHEQQSLIEVEPKVASLADVFSIVGNDEVMDAEKRYLPGKEASGKAIILAASKGERLAPLTDDKPKCMLDLRGEPLLKRLVDALKAAEISDVTVVGGYRADAIDLAYVDKRVNEDYATTGELATLDQALDLLDGRCLVSYGDVLVREFLVSLITQSRHDMTILVDASAKNRPASDADTRDYVKCSKPFTGDPLEKGPVYLENMTRGDRTDADMGEWVGMIYFSPAGSKIAKAEIEAMRKEGSLSTAGLPDLLNRLVKRGDKINVKYVVGHWLNVNDAFDLADARNFL